VYLRDFAELIALTLSGGYAFLLNKANLTITFGDSPFERLNGSEVA